MAVNKHVPGCCCGPVGGVFCNDTNPFPTVNLELEFEYLEVTLTETQVGFSDIQRSATCIVKTIVVSLVYTLTAGVHSWVSAVHTIRGHPAGEYLYPQNTLNPFKNSNCGWGVGHRWVISCSPSIGRNWVIFHRVHQQGTSNPISYREYDLNVLTFVDEPLYADFTTPLSTCPPNPPLNAQLGYCEGDRKHIVTLP